MQQRSLHGDPGAARTADCAFGANLSISQPWCSRARFFVVPALQNLYEAIAEALCPGGSTESKEVAMLSLLDIRYWLMLPFAIAAVVMLWILWNLMRDGRRK